MEGDAPIGRGHVVVGLAEHGIEAVQSHVLAQQPVSQAIDFQEPLQLLQHIKQQKMQRITTETADLIARGMVLYPHAHRTKDISLTQWPRPIALPLKGVLVQYFVNLQEAKLICSPLSTGWLSPQNPLKVETGNFTLLDSDAPVTYQRQQILYTHNVTATFIQQGIKSLDFLLPVYRTLLYEQTLTADCHLMIYTDT